MSTLSERISSCVKESGLTKTAFAEKINVTQQYVSNLCLGKKNPSDRTIGDICREFGISEKWLTTGEGDMHKEFDEDAELQKVFSEIMLSDDDLIKRIIRSYWGLKESEKDIIRKMVDGFLQK